MSHLPVCPQVDPGFAYAYTLLGHEFVLTEELDRALACFRNAIRVNNRHYNAWCGNHVNVWGRFKSHSVMYTEYL